MNKGQLAITEFTDGQCMDLVKNGDEKGFEELYRRHNQKLLRYLLRNVGGDRTTSEEISQNVWSRVFKYAKNYESRGTFIAWLFTVARNALHTELKINSKFPLLKSLEIEVEHTQWIDRGTSMPRSAPYSDSSMQESATNPEIKYLRKVEFNQISEAVNNLPEAQARVIRHVIQGGLSYADIAKQEKASVSSIKTKVFRARKSLLKLIGPKEYLKKAS